MDDENKYKTFCAVDNLSTSIEFLDFSTDNFYLLYKDSYDEVVIIELTNLKKINTVFVEFDIEWCSDGIKASDKAKVNTIQYMKNKIFFFFLTGNSNILWR